MQKTNFTDTYFHLIKFNSILGAGSATEIWTVGFSSEGFQ